jgi:hypothetical protein
VVPHLEHRVDPARVEPRFLLRLCRRQQLAAVTVARVGTACTLPESRYTWFWIMSNPAAVVGSPAI